MTSSAPAIPDERSPASPTPSASDTNEASHPAPTPSEVVIPDAQYNAERGPNSTKRITLTFDDCPRSMGAFRETILAAERADIGLALFPTGNCVLEGDFDPDHARAHGHHVFNHSITHPDLTRLSLSGAILELGAPGIVTSYGRPPFGELNSTVWEAYRAVDMRVWTWTLDTHDWHGKPQEELVDFVVSRASGSDSVLMHMQWNDFNGEALVQMKSGLAERGLEVCRNHPGTVPERPAGMWC